MPPIKLTSDSYRVGWICPLEVEQIAALEMLDEEHLALEQSWTDNNVYTLGSINGHNVVIAGLPQTGNCSAATVMTQMKMTFKNLRYGLLVGIGGGVPTKTDNGMVRLGHVVVSQPTREHFGTIQYDHGKAIDGRFERTGCLGPPPTELLRAAQRFAEQRGLMDFDPVWRDTLRFNTKLRGLRKFKFPGRVKDHLYQPDYVHQQHGMSCEKGGCSPERRIERPFDEDDEEFVVVHRGTIASGEMVIKDASRRDRLAKRDQVLCFEMEAAGALTGFPCMVIRGISDYCDSHKNNIWHGFAAAAAAAYARQLFFHIPIELVQEPSNNQCKRTTFNLPFYLPDIRRIPTFVAREGELTSIHAALRGAARCRCITILHGIGGIGKTQLAIEYFYRYRKDYSTSIWLDARDEATINQSFARLAERINSYDASVDYISAAVQGKNHAQVVAAVKRWFEEPENNSWLAIYDNYDPQDQNYTGTKDKDVSPLLKENNSRTGPVNPEREATSEPYDIRKYLPDTDHGAIIVTSRVTRRKLGYHIEIEKFQHLKEGLDILASTSGRENIRLDCAAIKLARRLDGLPLALASTGAYLEQVPVTCTEYLQEYDKFWVQLPEDTSDLPSYDKALCTTWNISYTHIKRQDSNAAFLLHQWAYFDRKDLWYELLQSGGNKPDWLRGLTKDALTFHCVMKLLCKYGLAHANLLNTPNTMQPAESASYGVHACVHSWMVHVLNRDVCEEMARAALHCIVSYIPAQNQPGFLSKQQRLLGHADQCYDMTRTIHLEIGEMKLLSKLGYLYLNQGRRLEAGAIFERVLQSRLKEAGAMLNQALRGQEKAFGLEHLSTIDTINRLVHLYKEQDQLKEAEDLYKGALQVKGRLRARATTRSRYD